MTALRAAIRVFRTRRRFAFWTAAAYALGIAAVTTVFSPLDDVLLDPLPWPASGRVVGVWERFPQVTDGRIPAAPAKVAAWRGATDVFDAVAAWRLDDMDFSDAGEGAGDGEPEVVQVGRVQADLFRLLGIRPTQGRGFAAGEDEPGAEHVVVLTNGFWRERMGGRRDVLGRTLRLAGEPFRIIGVLPPDEAFPADARLLVPLAFDAPDSRAAHAYRVLAHLAPGVTLARAQARVSEMAAAAASEFPETDAGWEAEVVPLRDQLVGDVRGLLLLFFGAGALVFLVGGANGAGLLLARSAGRRRELALRAALGASRRRLVADLAAESVLLAAVGGAAGFFLAWVAAGAIRTWMPLHVPGLAGGSFDATVLAFAAGATLLGGLAFGLLPGLQASGTGPMDALREGVTGTPGRGRILRAVVVGEVALAALLLVGGGLFLRSAWEVSSVDPGFRPRGLLTLELRPPRWRYDSEARRAALYQDVLSAVQSMPGVESAALTNYLPLGGRSDSFRYLVEGRPAPASPDLQLTGMRVVSPGYFGTMGIPLVSGRALTPGDRADGELVAVVNGAMAREVWPAGDAVGARVSMNGQEGPWVRVVGVVGDVHHGGLDEPASPELFVPLAQEVWPFAALVVRAGSDPAALAAAVRDVVRRVDPALPIADVRTGSGLLRAATAPWRAQATLVLVFAAAALLLAITGVYGLLAWVVEQRIPEMAIRQALGAARRDVRTLVAREALRLALIGAALGLVAAAALSALVRTLLFGVRPLDPWSYAAAAGLLTLVALLAALGPARRAARTEPASSLRV